MSNLRNINLQVAEFAMSCVTSLYSEEKREYIEKIEKDKKANAKAGDNEISTMVENDIKNLRKNYKTVSKKVSTLIQNNGFINTLAFCLSKYKKGNEYEVVLDNIISWSIENKKIKGILEVANNKENKYTRYIDKIIELDQRKYRLVSKEIIVLFGWIKRFADGIIEDEE